MIGLDQEQPGSPERAPGIAGLIKMIPCLAASSDLREPALETPNPQIPFEDLRLGRAAAGALARNKRSGGAQA